MKGDQLFGILIFLIFVLFAITLTYISTNDESEKVGKQKATEMVCKQSQQVRDGDLEQMCGLMLDRYSLSFEGGKVVKDNGSKD